MTRERNRAQMTLVPCEPLPRNVRFLRDPKAHPVHDVKAYQAVHHQVEEVINQLRRDRFVFINIPNQHHVELMRTIIDFLYSSLNVQGIPVPNLELKICSQNECSTTYLLEVIRPLVARSKRKKLTLI